MGSLRRKMLRGALRRARRRAAGNSASAPAVARAAFGSYTGNGTSQVIDVGGRPDLLIICPANGDPVTWKNRTAWHGRNQHLHALNSFYRSGEDTGLLYWPFETGTIRVENVQANTAGVVYHWIALTDNGSGDLQETSWIGNALSGRTIKYASKQLDFVIVKRDSTLAAAMRALSSTVSFRGDSATGTFSEIVSIDADGITLSNSNWVNQNNNAALGEGIEVIGFANGQTFEVQRVAGTGAQRTLTFGFPVAAVFVLDETNDASAAAHVVKTPTMTSDNAKPFNAAVAASGVTVSGNQVTLPAAYSKVGDNYVVLAIRDQSAQVVNDPTYNLAGASGLMSANLDIEMTDFPNVSGAVSYEFFGKVVTGQRQEYYPLMMFGSAPTGTLATQGGTYNGGVYAYQTDPDANGWKGPVIRVIHSDYLSLDRSEGSINYYNMNTGVVLPVGRDFHLLVTHNGTGFWQVFLDGKKVKDYNLNLNQATYGNRRNGGVGNAVKDRILGGWTPGDTFGNGPLAGERAISGCVYRTAVWSSELTLAEALSRGRSLRNGGPAYSGPAPTKEYDFRGGSLPAGVTAGVGLVTANAASAPIMPTFVPGPVGSRGEPARLANGDVEVVGSAANGRVVFYVPPTRQVTLRTLLEPTNATRIICRISTDGGVTGTAVFDLTTSSLIDRTDVITVPEGSHVAYVGVMSTGQKFVIKSGTGITV